MTKIERLSRDELASHAGELVSSLENRIEHLECQRGAILFFGFVFITLYLI
jgi:hypothetical protein